MCLLYKGLYHEPFNMFSPEQYEWIRDKKIMLEDESYGILIHSATMRLQAGPGPKANPDGPYMLRLCLILRRAHIMRST